MEIGNAAQWCRRFLLLVWCGCCTVAGAQESADALLAAGRYAEAIPRLQAQLETATDTATRVRMLVALGEAQTQYGDASAAEHSWTQALRLDPSPATHAAVRLGQGNGKLASHDREGAIADYRDAVRSADAAADALLGARARINLARLVTSEADTLLRQAESRLDGLADTSAVVMSRLAIGIRWLALSAAGRAERTFKTAEAQATRLGDARLGCYAQGYLGAALAARGQRTAALTATRRALATASQLAAPELLYRWQWQLGRLLAEQGERSAAIEVYRQAVAQLQVLRGELAANPGQPDRLYESLGPVYFGLADLLLQRAADSGERGEQDRREARDLIEQLRAAELRDYFGDECVTTFQTRITPVGGDQHTAIIYPILLPDRLEMLVGRGDALRQVTLPITRRALTEEVDALRRLLEKRSTNEYLPLAQRLYERLLRPLEALLDGADTLVFVPDGALRTIPLGALHDGQRFVIERWVVAVTPGLKLTDARPLQRKNLQALVVGVSASVQGLSALPAVRAEVDGVRAAFDGELLLDEDFSAERFSQALRRQPYAIVHIASHGSFGSDPRRTWLLTWDRRLDLDHIEQDIGVGRYRDEPLELLTLSACETAAGDERAALGLAGVALKAGARSALATLWQVDDRATEQLVTHFYQALRTQGKAAALRSAQLALLAERRYHHPGFWAPFLLIGNWQ